MQIFIPEKYWEGLGGLSISTEVQVTIAAQIGVVVMGFRTDYLDRLRTIIVHPQSQAKPRESRHHGVVTEQLSVVHGEALMGGPVRYVWPLVLQGSRHPGDGQNVVYHEIAHVLDMLDGFIDGTPPLTSAARYRKWEAVIQAEYSRLVQAVEYGYATFLDAYGADLFSRLCHQPKPMSPIKNRKMIEVSIQCNIYLSDYFSDSNFYKEVLPYFNRIILPDFFISLEIRE